MAPPTRTPRGTWIDAALGFLSAGGPDAVRVEPLARALGVTRGGFYWHFEDRQALLDELLDTWERRAVEDVVARVESDGGDARTRLRRLFALASEPSGGEVLRIDLAVRDWARREPAVARRLRRVDDRRMDYMRSLFAELCPRDDDEVESRCLIAFSLWIGNHFVAAGHGPRSRRDVMRRSLERLLA